ncbi:phosphoenolpyruvate carboxylase [Raphidocelis subcapitata]|uniref:phosphoenolpyruvate carboxylase n=1 Tax=Raphidocelis subcapitata TaxID=307507 RepID=A0A2V0PHD5_9CHLO|nr:phosphoenolpyruvate carboxylase [Raphidocelis subcapitata]|eukprot:GBF96435.1 phosphoenolpyruvate carboxylase [Raphidocelis subcapitata]
MLLGSHRIPAVLCAYRRGRAADSPKITSAAAPARPAIRAALARAAATEAKGSDEGAITGAAAGFDARSAPPVLKMSFMEPSVALNAKQLLREDDSLLRQIFFNVLKHHHPQLAAKVDVIYALSQAWCKSREDGDFDILERYLGELKPEELILVASSFSHMLNLHNLTEEVANTQTERAGRMGQLVLPTRSTNASFIKLTTQNGVKPEEIYKALCDQTVQLVLTAHPTQAFRQSLLKKYAQVRRLLDELHNKRMSNYEKLETLEAIRAAVQAAWRTDEIRRQKPTPQDEMRHGLSYFQQTIIDSLPVYMRRVDTALANIGQPRLPLDHSLFEFGSWMGGDRDGNPNVTAATTRDVCILARLEAVNYYFVVVEHLMFDLSIWRCSPELKAFAKRLAAKSQGVDPMRVQEERKKRNYADFWTPVAPNEPFRVVLSALRDRLWETREVLHQCMVNPNLSVRAALAEADCFVDKKELFEPLKLMYDSLVATGDESTANAKLLDVLRQVQCFGLALMRLDIRQESTRHTEVMDSITTHLELGSYAEWPEERRLEFLLGELRGRRPLFPPGLEMTPDVKEVVSTLRMLSELPGHSLGAYVISMARTASDVLAVVLLQRECGVRAPLRVVPLFETLEDLHNAPATMTTLFSSEWYLAHIDGVQECMIGYSDSGKDAGRMAAAWALFETQQRIVEIAKQFGVRMVLFHGRGGSVGRGGGPTQMAIRSQPPGTINGALRVTIQGETIEQQFGEREVCFRTLDLYTSAVLEAGLDPPSAPKKEWRELMDRLSRVSCEVYRSFVFRRPEFVEYFNHATPAQELGRLNIGSRPASRKVTKGVEGLRAIPWVFAWTQTRLHLPVWLGIGDALSEAIEAGHLAELQEMYDNWPFFQSLLDLVEMVMAKADPRVTSMYDAKLVRPELQALGDELRAKYQQTKAEVLRIERHTDLLEGAAAAAAAATPAGAAAAVVPESDLDEKIRLRDPYVTPLNVMQVLALQSLRSFNAGDLPGSARDYRPSNSEVVDLLSRDPHADDKHPFQAAMEDCLMISIKGISAGMQNTG